MKSYIGIEDIFAHEILDSRGIPTIETEVYTDDGNIGRASVPAVTSPGQYELTNCVTETKPGTWETVCSKRLRL